MTIRKPGEFPACPPANTEGMVLGPDSPDTTRALVPPIHHLAAET